MCYCTGPCFIIGRSRLQNPITLRLVFDSWQLLASFVYSARILEEFHLIHLDLSPTYLAFHNTSGQEGVNASYSLAPAYDFSLRLVGYDKLPCIINAYCFIGRTHHLDLLSKLLVSYYATCFSGTVGTRFLA